MVSGLRKEEERGLRMQTHLPSRQCMCYGHLYYHLTLHVSGHSFTTSLHHSISFDCSPPSIYFWAYHLHFSCFHIQFRPHLALTFLTLVLPPTPHIDSSPHGLLYPLPHCCPISSPLPLRYDHRHTISRFHTWPLCHSSHHMHFCLAAFVPDWGRITGPSVGR